MDLTKVGLDEFLAFDRLVASPPPIVPRNFWVPRGTGVNLSVLRSNSGYAVVVLDDRAGNVAAITPDGDEAGYYVGEWLIVHDEHRCRGLAVAMVLWAYHFRQELPLKRSLSRGGRAALTAAWAVANGKKDNPWWP